MDREVILLLLPGLVVILLVIVENGVFKVVGIGIGFIKDTLSRYR